MFLMMLLFFSKEVNIVLIFMFLCVIIMIINTKVKQKMDLVLVFEKKVLSLQKFCKSYYN